MLLFSPDAVMVSGVFAIFVANWRKLDSYWFSRPCCEIRPGFLYLPCKLFHIKNIFSLIARSCCETRPGFSFQAQK